MGRRAGQGAGEANHSRTRERATEPQLDARQLDQRTDPALPSAEAVVSAESAGRQAGAAGRCWSTCRGSSPRTTPKCPIRRSPAQRVAFGTSGHRGSAFETQLQRMARPRHQPGDLRLPQAAAASTARCSSASTRTRSPRPRWRARSRCWPPTASTSCSRSDDEYTPTPAVSHAILTYNRGRTAGLADGIVVTPSHNPPDRRRLQVQPAERRAGRRAASPAGSRRGRTRFSQRGAEGREARCRSSKARGAATTHRARLPATPMSSDLAQRHRHGRASAARAFAWASIRWAAPASITGRRSPSATA